VAAHIPVGIIFIQRERRFVEWQSQKEASGV
jgi:hypothetical protein